MTCLVSLHCYWGPCGFNSERAKQHFRLREYLQQGELRGRATILRDRTRDLRAVGSAMTCDGGSIFMLRSRQTEF